MRLSRPGHNGHERHSQECAKHVLELAFSPWCSYWSSRREILFLLITSPKPHDRWKRFGVKRHRSENFVNLAPAFVFHSPIPIYDRLGVRQ